MHLIGGEGYRGDMHPSTQKGDPVSTLLSHTLSQMETMGSFEKQFENLDLQTAVMDDVMGKQVRTPPLAPCPH